MVSNKIKFIIASLAATKQVSAGGRGHIGSWNQGGDKVDCWTTIEDTVYSVPSVTIPTHNWNVTIATTNAVTTSDYDSTTTTSFNGKSVTTSNYTSSTSGRITTTIPEVIDNTITVNTSKIVTVTSCAENACETKKYYHLSTTDNTANIVTTYVLSTSYTTVEDTITEYTTWCPLTATEATGIESSTFITPTTLATSFKASVYSSVSTTSTSRDTTSVETSSTYSIKSNSSVPAESTSSFSSISTYATHNKPVVSTQETLLQSNSSIAASTIFELSTSFDVTTFSVSSTSSSPVESTPVPT